MRNKASILECSGNYMYSLLYTHKNSAFAHTMYLYVSYDHQSRLIISVNSRKWFAVVCI